MKCGLLEHRVVNKHRVIILFENGLFEAVSVTKLLVLVEIELTSIHDLLSRYNL